MPWLFLLASTTGFLFTINAFWPVSNHRRFFVPSFLFSWLTMELAGYHLAWQAAATWVFVHLGALGSWPGRLGLGLSVLSWTGLVVLVLQGRRAHGIVAAELHRLAIDMEPHRLPRTRLLVPFPVRLAHSRRIKDVPYRRVAGRELRLDVYLPQAQGRGRPAIVQVHGGAWVIGDKREQGVPLLVHLSDHGFVGFNVNYRLSPGATFPDHLIDLKAAIAWIRAHADDYGVDPDFIAVTGGSAGGHLAAMLALTGGQPEYQPGFAHADTRVQACVPLYGVYDLANRLGTHGPRYVDGFIGPIVLKAFYAEEPHRFHDASPIDRVHEDAPPFFVIHGDRDTMSPLEDARLFVDRLAAVSREPVLFAEIPGAQHAFDVFVSPRSAPVIEAVTAFLVEAHRRHAAARAGLEAAGPARATGS